MEDERELDEHDLKLLDEMCAYVWANDPDVTIHLEKPEPDENAPHGVNEEAEMNVSVDTSAD